jgi:hypothetical protein
MEIGTDSTRHKDQYKNKHRPQPQAKKPNE